MKILTGKFRGKNFYMPANVRPSQNILRKAIFDILGHDLEGLRVLELFAGSGAVGLEALSLGAKEAVFVDHDPKCIEVIEKNVNLLFPEGYDSDQEWEIAPTDAFLAIKQLSNKNSKFDIIFLDPPYLKELAKKILNLLLAYDIVHANSFLVVQHDIRELLPDISQKFNLIKRKNYGKNCLTIFQAN